MDDLFASARKQYYDNFLQWSLTGDSKYKKAYEEAKQRMDSIIDSLQHQIDSTGDTGDVVHKLRENKSRLLGLASGWMEAKNKETEAKMRGTEPQTIPNLRVQYITLGSLVGFALLLALL